MKYGERYKTAKERSVAFEKWCRDTRTTVGCANCKATEDRHGFICCVLEWLDLEAEEKKPMNCPFCGGEIYLAYDSYGQAYVGCKSGNCVYTYCNDGKSDYEIIAAHNRVCKAVAAYKESEVRDGE